MGNLLKTALFSLVLLTSLSAQTLLMKPGNAVQYGFERKNFIKLCTDSAHINENIFFVFKQFTLGESNYPSYKYERIQGDSIHIALDNSNEEVILFNFNWKQGDTLSVDTVSSHIVYAIMDTIEIFTDSVWTDTVYTVSNYNIDVVSGDTISIESNKTYSKKFGLVSTHLLIMTGKKIDGIRYGLIDPFPDEVYLSHDSLYFYSRWDTVTFIIYNTSSAIVRIDSLHINDYTRSYEFGFGKDSILLNNHINWEFPQSQGWEDSVFIAAGDSIYGKFFILETCAICKQNEISGLFADSLKITFSFNSNSNTGRLYFKKAIVFRGDVSASVDDKNLLPKFNLSPNYPNPFNSSTNIEFYVNERSNVQLSLYDMLGSKITDILSEERLPGNHKLSFDAGKLNLASGVYFLNLKAANNHNRIYQQNIKIIYLK